MGSCTSTQIELKPTDFATFNHQKIEPKAELSRSSVNELMVDGFIRTENERWQLIIPCEIMCIIKNIINSMKIKGRSFKHYQRATFKLSANNTIVTPIGLRNHFNCYMIYPSPNGFRRGVHVWSVKYVKCNGMNNGYRSIGVTTRMNDHWIRNGVGLYKKWPAVAGNDFLLDGSHYDGWNKWSIGSTMRVLLDLDCGRVEYLCDGEKVKEEKLKLTNDTFYFALCIFSDKRYGVFESVDW